MSMTNSNNKIQREKVPHAYFWHDATHFTLEFRLRFEPFGNTIRGDDHNSGVQRYEHNNMLL